MTKIQDRDTMLEPYINIVLNDEDLSGNGFRQYIENITFVDEENKIPTATINVNDIDGVWTNSGNIKRGTPIKINAGHRLNRRDWIRGVIHYMSGDFKRTGEPGMAIGVIEKSGLDLTKEREEKTYKNKKISDIVKSMLSSCGAKSDVQDTKAVLESVPFNQESYADFIIEWAKNLGWTFKKDEERDIYIFKDTRDKNVKGVLSYRQQGMEIQSFRPMFQDPMGMTDKTDEDGNIEKTKSNIGSKDGKTYRQKTSKMIDAEKREIKNRGDSFGGGTYPVRKAKGKEL